MKETQVNRGSTVMKAGAAGAAIAACAACCAPLLAPLLAWLGLSGMGMAAAGWYVEIAVLAAAGLCGVLVLRHRRAARQAKSCRVDGGCGCGSGPKV